MLKFLSNRFKAKRRDIRYTISREVLEMAIAASRDSYPHEFIAMLGGKVSRSRVHVSELIFLPAVSGSVSAVLHTDMLPLGVRVLGTIHSHPSTNFNPSLQDLETFSKQGVVHVIIAYPYTMDSWRAYNSRGEVLKLEVVDE